MSFLAYPSGPVLMASPICARQVTCKPVILPTGEVGPPLSLALSYPVIFVAGDIHPRTSAPYWLQVIP